MTQLNQFKYLRYKNFEVGINCIDVSCNFSFSRKMLTSTKVKQPSLSFSIERFMLG